MPTLGAVSITRLSRLPEWPIAFDPGVELDWGDPTISRRLLMEHLDQAHDGASRRTATVDVHVTRLRRLLPSAPARLLDAGCGPGLYSVRLARAGYTVTGIDVGEAVLAHGARLARSGHLDVDFARTDLRTLPVPAAPYDAALLIYFVFDGFRRRDQLRVLRRVRAALRPGGTLIAELRLRPDQLPGRITTWDVVPRSLLCDEPHVLLVDTTWDEARHTYVLREVALLDDGTALAQQTTSRLSTFAEVPALFARCGFRVARMYDGWSRHRATDLSESLLVVAERV